MSALSIENRNAQTKNTSVRLILKPTSIHATGHCVVLHYCAILNKQKITNVVLKQFQLSLLRVDLRITIY